MYVSTCFTVPHDQASLKKTLSEISAELDSVVKAVPSLVSSTERLCLPRKEIQPKLTYLLINRDSPLKLKLTLNLTSKA
jgi:hypothetical protein